MTSISIPYRGIQHRCDLLLENCFPGIVCAARLRCVREVGPTFSFGRESARALLSDPGLPTARMTHDCYNTGDLVGESPECARSGWNGTALDARNVEGIRGSPGRIKPSSCV